VTHAKLVLVLVVLAVCGGTFASSSSAAGSTVVATVQAEQMTLPTGASVINSSTASGGKAVMLTEPGSSLTTSVPVAGAVTTVDVVAHGARCQRGWPAMTVSLDGKTVLNSASVNSSSWQNYSAVASLAAGSHTLSISDSAAASCRTLYVDEIIFSSSAPVPATPTVSLIATPASVVTGSSSTLTWSTTNATSCVGSGGWSGSQSTSGSLTTGALSASTGYTLTCTGSGGNASSTATVTVTRPPTKLCQAIAIPAYFYPSGGAGLWGSALAAEPGVGVMIANVDNGPGISVDTDYTAAITKAQGTGVSVFGYVYTSYAGRSLASVESDISAWRKLYGVTNIFLDEASTSSSSLSYYQALSSYVHQAFPDALTIVNFGTIPGSSEMSAGDIAVTFEGSYSTYQSTRFPSWVSSFAPTRFYNIVYSVPDQASMLSALSEAAGDHVGYVYATNDGLPNPYDTLPPYLSGETSEAHSGC
jgi:Spherulation-specific family 4